MARGRRKENKKKGFLRPSSLDFDFPRTEREEEEEEESGERRSGNGRHEKERGEEEKEEKKEEGEVSYNDESGDGGNRGGGGGGGGGGSGVPCPPTPYKPTLCHMRETGRWQWEEERKRRGGFLYFSIEPEREKGEKTTFYFTRKY